MADKVKKMGDKLIMLKGKRISVRVTDEEYKILKNNADKSNMKFSDYIRKMILLNKDIEQYKSFLIRSKTMYEHSISLSYIFLQLGTDIVNHLRRLPDIYWKSKSLNNRQKRELHSWLKERIEILKRKEYIQNQIKKGKEILGKEL